MNQLLHIPNWDEIFMHDTYWWASKSRDPRTKIGAVLVHWDTKDPISHAYNGIVRGVADLEERMIKPEKYFWMSHAERNCCFNCANTGRSSKGTTMFTQGIPCSDCADAVIQCGIKEIVVHKQWQKYESEFNWEKWNESSKRSKIKFFESGVKIRVFDGILGMQGMLDGKIIEI